MRKKCISLLVILVGVACIGCNSSKSSNSTNSGDGTAITQVLERNSITTQPSSTVIEEQQEPLPLHIFAKEEVEVIPAVPKYEFSEACQLGKLQKIEGDMPGTGLGTWYTVEIDGVEYYYAEYETYSGAEKEVVWYGYSVISDTYSLQNGIKVGMSMEELLELYPGVAVIDVENGGAKNNVKCGMGWNNTAYPHSYMGTDSSWDYNGVDYRWENQFDEILIADTDYLTEYGLPFSIAFLIKDDVIAAFTFYYPTAG